MPPTAPPARPHSAHPHRALPPGLFRTSSSPRPGARPGSAASGRSVASVPHRRGRRSHDWEDGDDWDSSSDKDDGSGRDGDDGGEGEDDLSQSQHRETQTQSRSAAQPVPIPRADTGDSVSGSISTSWVSASLNSTHTPAHSTPPGIASTSGAPSTRALAGPRTSTSAESPPKPFAPAPTRLPPGGAWEMVEPADAAEPSEPQQVGPEAVRGDADDVLRDPMHLLAGLSLSTPTSPGDRSGAGTPSLFGPPSGRNSPRFASAIERKRSVRTERRREGYVRTLNQDRGAVDLAELKRLAWNGVPEEVRPIVWQLLLGYMPLAVQPRLTTLSRKRKEYAQLVDQYFGRGLASLDQQMWHQIEIDVPRTRPGAPLWSCTATQRALERILYVWAIRHPASGYVQGINDLATPFFEVFLSGYVSVDPENFDVGHLPDDVLAAVEADSFWCLTKLLDGIQDHYISQQPGIQRLVRRMGDLVKRIDPALAAHFDEHGVEYMQFAFRWMNCLLMREISVKCTIRMWDTYLSEGADAFSQFHLYVCCALLVKFSDRLREMDFQEIIMFLQRLPTAGWTDREIGELLSEAFVLKNVWHGAENHFAGANGTGGTFGMMGR